MAASLSVRAFKMIFDLTKEGKVYYVIMHNFIWANKNTESFIYNYIQFYAHMQRLK